MFRNVDRSVCPERKMHVASSRQASEENRGPAFVKGAEERKSGKNEKQQLEEERKIKVGSLKFIRYSREIVTLFLFFSLSLG